MSLRRMRVMLTIERNTDLAATHRTVRVHLLCRLLVVFSLAGLAAWAQNAPTIASVLNLFDYSQTNLSPGALVAIYGSNFGTSATAVTITVGGKPGYVVPNTDR